MELARTLSGDEMIVLSAAEYEALKDTSADQLDALALEKALEEQEGLPTMPHELVDQLLSGDISPLSAWRQAVGLTQQELAEKAGVRKATISEIENGKLDPRLSTLEKISDVLGLGIDDIV